MTSIKQRALALALLLASPLSQAAPFAVADVVPEASTCIWMLDATQTTSTPANNVCKLDLAGTSVGSHVVKVAVEDAVWGSASRSPFASLTFVRPATLVAPPSIRLAP